jgi:hypothetical protein
MRFLGAILTLSLSSTPSANDDIPKELFNSIKSLSKVEQVLEHAIQQCVKNSATLSAEELLQTDPNYFGGITPKSAKWIEIVKIHSEYVSKTCNYFEQSGTAELYTRALLDGYTLAEAKELEEYFLSDLGRKLTEQTLKASIQMQSSLSKEYASYGVELNKWYLKHIHEVINRPAQPNGG